MRPFYVPAVAAVLLSWSFLCIAQNHTASAADKLAADFDAAGLSSLRYGDAEIISKSDVTFRVDDVWFITPANAGQRGELKETKRTFDKATRRITVQYPWGTTSCDYKIQDDQFGFLVTIQNTTAQPLHVMAMEIARVRLPGRDLTNVIVDNISSFGGVSVPFKTGVFALLNWEVEKPVVVNCVPKPNAASGNPLRIAFRPTHPKHSIVDASHFETPGRTIAPGASDQYRVSMTFAPPETSTGTILKEAFENVREKRPSTLAWKDRRPIGRLFMANPTTGWKGNPRGYIFGKKEKEDVYSEAGLAEFEKSFAQYINGSIANLKRMNAQGVILWDIEGAEFPHPITYLGHPQMLPKASPEMDRIIDAQMKKLKDAGFETGICIRPTEVYETGKVFPRLDQRDVADPLTLMSEKIAYAKKRWGCRLFYLDSNVFENKINQMYPVPWVMPTSMIAALHKQHPDVLIIPEWSANSYAPISAPYHAAALGQRETSGLLRNIWPEAFSVMAVDERALEQGWDAYVGGLRRGDVMFFSAWYHAPENDRIALAYREADYLRAGPPDNLDSLPVSQLVEKAADADGRTRYFVAKLLGATKAKEAVAPLMKMLDDTDALVQKNAILAFRDLGPFWEPTTADRLLGFMTNPGGGQRQILRGFATGVVPWGGEQAVPALTKLVTDPKINVDLRRSAVTALGYAAKDDSEAADAILPLLRHDQLKEAAVDALGALKSHKAVEPLCAIVSAPYNRDREFLKARAVIALGEIGDIRAFHSIVRLFDENFTTVVVYYIRHSQDGSLKQITGASLSGAAQWRAWAKANPQKLAGGAK